MAKIKLGIAITDLRGSLGGHVFLKGRGGAVVRINSGQVKRNSNRQSLNRRRYSDIVRTWRTLSAVQRNSWNVASGEWFRADVFGDVRQMSGFNLYIRLNQLLPYVGSAYNVLPPLPGLVPSLVSLSGTASVSGSTVTLTANPTTPPAPIAWLIYGSPYVSLGVREVASSFNFFGSLASPSTIPNQFTNQQGFFGTMKVGQAFSIKVLPINYNTGQVGVASIVRIVVSA